MAKLGGPEVVLHFALRGGGPPGSCYTPGASAAASIASSSRQPSGRRFRFCPLDHSFLFARVLRLGRYSIAQPSAYRWPAILAHF